MIQTARDLGIRSPLNPYITTALGVVRLPEGAAHSFAGRDFPIPVMGKTGTTNDFRDALARRAAAIDGD